MEHSGRGGFLSILRPSPIKETNQRRTGPDALVHQKQKLLKKLPENTGVTGKEEDVYMVGGVTLLLNRKDAIKENPVNDGRFDSDEECRRKTGKGGCWGPLPPDKIEAIKKKWKGVSETDGGGNMRPLKNAFA